MAPKYKRALTFDEYTTEKCDVIVNKLLGDYNANGIYVINKKVSAELLELKKLKKESYNNEIFCTAKTSSGRIIDFDISFKKNSQSKMAVAELYVLEGVPKQGGRMMNVLKTPIAKFTQEITPNFVDLALAKFNVVLEVVDEGQEVKEVDDAYITKRNMLLGYLDKMTADNYNIIYEDYFTQRVNLLKSMNNAYSKKILAIFNEEFNKMSDFFLVDKKNKKVTNFKAMNELLDKAFEDISGLEQYAENEKMYKERILPILSMFIQGAERVESSAMKSVLDTVPKRLKDALTEALIDKKQMGESRIEPTVKETSKETLQRELDSSVENMKNKLERLGRTKGTTKVDEEERVITDSTPSSSASRTSGDSSKSVPRSNLVDRMGQREEDKKNEVRTRETGTRVEQAPVTPVDETNLKRQFNSGAFKDYKDSLNKVGNGGANKMGSGIVLSSDNNVSDLTAEQAIGVGGVQDLEGEADKVRKTLDSPKAPLSQVEEFTKGSMN